MSIVRWEPFRDFAEIQDRMNRLVNVVSAGRGWEEPMTRGAWVPSVDVHQSADRELVFAVELPGMKREDIDVTVEHNTLTIRGERKQSTDVKEEQYHRVERAYGTFSRSFSLPETVDSAKVRAEYKEGVLTLTVPMREEAKPKQIEVKVA